MEKQTKSALIILGVILAVIVLYQANEGMKYSKSLVRETFPSLTSEQRNALEIKIAEANQVLERSDDATDATYDALLKKGQALQGLGKLAEAQDIYMEAKGLFKGNSGVYRDLAEVQIEMRDLKGARKNLEKFVAMNDDSAGRWARLIDFHYDSLHSSEETLQGLYKEALEKTNNNSELVTKYARFLEEVEDLQGAKDHWMKAIAADPEDKTVYEAEVKRLDEKMAQPK